MSAQTHRRPPALPARRLRVPARGPLGPTALRKLRLDTVATLNAWRMCALADAACLIVDELLANVVRHAPQTGTASVALLLDNKIGGVRIEVSDCSADLPIRKESGVLDERGRGLQLIDSLADRWGAEPIPAGKTVYAILP